jgi:putative ABC transport system ATP-binding protein
VGLGERAHFTLRKDTAVQAVNPVLLLLSFQAAVICAVLGVWLWRQAYGPFAEGEPEEARGAGTATVPLPMPRPGPRRKPVVPLFALRAVSKSYREPSGRQVPVLRCVNLDLYPGVTGILGPSGQGKSTLLHLLAGLDVPDGGVIFFRGQALPEAEGPALRAYRGRHVSFVFQDLNLVTHLTAEENAALPLLCRGTRRREALARARQNLELVGLGELAGRLPAQLSGGEKQRVALARAFAADADVTLADEPTGSLDTATGTAVMRAFRDLARLHDRPVVLVTHDEALAARFCDRLVRCSPHGFVEAAPRRPALEEDGLRFPDEDAPAEGA